MKRTHIAIGIILLYGIALSIESRHRIIDGDEGYYSSAARLVSEGEIPYLDFFYPQSPMLPFVYGGWALLGGHSLASFRFLSVLLSAATAALWAWYLLKEQGQSVWVAMTTLLVLLLNPFLASWGVTVKTYALANFLVTAALMSIWRGAITGNNKWWIIAGALTGLLVSSRLLYVAVPLAIICWTFFHHRSDASIRFRRPIWFTAGFVAACTPALFLFLINPDAYIFNNIGYHLLQSEGRPLLFSATSALTFLFDTHVNHPYLIFQVALAGLGVVSLFAQETTKRPGGFSLAIVSLVSMSALILVSLRPIPHYEQYITSPLEPFFVPLTGLGVQRLWSSARAAIVAPCVVAVSLSLLEFANDNKASSGNKGWDIPAYQEVATYIRSHSAVGDTVLSLWPGYVCESGREYSPGLENHFGLLVAHKLTSKQRQNYHIAGTDQVISAMESKRPKMVIIGAWVAPFFEKLGDGEKQRFNRILNEHYHLSALIGGVDVYERK